jgi:putative aldouronate transport system permease protein
VTSVQDTAATPGTGSPQGPVPSGPAAAAVRRTTPLTKPPRQTWREALRKDWRLYSFVVLPLAFFLVFRYLPMAGNVIEFRRFRPGGNIFGE